MNLVSKSSEAVRWTATSSLVTSLLGLVQVTVLARILGPEDFGAIAILGVIITICEIFVLLGFTDVIVVNRNLNTKQLSTLYWVNLLIGILMYSLLYIAAGFIPFVFEYEGIVSIARVMGINLILGAFAVQFSALLRRELRFISLSVLGMCQAILGVTVAIFLALNDCGVWSLVYSMVVVSIFKSLVLIVFAIRNSWLPLLFFDLKGASEQLRFGSFRVAAGLINSLNSHIDQIVIGVFLGPVALGYYNVAFSIAIKPFTKINPILTQVLIPVFSRLTSDRDKMRSGYRKALRLLMFVNAPLLLGYIAIAPQLVDLFLGPDWEPVISVSRVLAVYVLFRSAANLNAGLIVANGKYRWPLFINAFILIFVPVTMVVVSMLTESIIAVSVVMVVVYMLVFVSAYFLFVRPLLGPFGKQFAFDFLLPVSVAIMMAAAVMQFSWVSNISDTFLETAVLVGFGVVVYLFLSVLLQRQNFHEIRKI